MRPEEALFHRVERRRADVAVNDADRAQHQLGEGFLRSVMSRRLIGRQDVVGCNTGHAHGCEVWPHKDSMWKTVAAHMVRVRNSSRGYGPARRWGRFSRA